MNDTVTTKLSFATICKTIGAVVLGGIIGIMLYGLTIHQVYRYFKMYPKDRATLKALVLIILALESWHILLWGVAGYHYLIEEPYTAQTSSELSINGNWSVRLSVIATSLTIGATQCFYAWRVYNIGPHYKWLVTPAVLFLVVDKGFAFAAGIEAFRETSTVADFQRLNWLVAASYGLASVTDLTLAGTLVFVLHKSRTGSKRTDSVLDTLIKYTINTGVLTSLLAFIFAIILPGNLIYAGISIVGTKLYANSVLAVLNSRREINNRLEDDFASVSIATLSRDPGTGGMRQTGTEASMAWVPAQRSLNSFDTEGSLAHDGGMMFARGTDGKGPNHAMAV
ncbi:hypothetical protein ONZ51_g4041 [Trametes cubensis]|uniref:DUF6534 domain-containing protein n=1 Tax=Trametes cubensis TaxID=1111947 RepID=A0AAD7XCH3_9APHY|nr:hypothetical protein ONZ51_g4041 [Trametes cubensis]